MGSLLGLGATRRDRPWFDIAFRTAAERFRMIDDQQQHLVIRYDSHADQALDELRRSGPSRATLRALQRYTIPVPPKIMARLQTNGDVEDIADGVTVLVTEGLYEREGVGLLAPTENES
jgi:CRISPR-associated endonuclease/helicase Cas3